MNPCIKHPRTMDTSGTLTQARTILGRTESAIATVEHDIAAHGREKTRYVGYSVPSERYTYEMDADAETILAKMRAVVELLEPYRKCWSKCGGRK